MKRVSVFPIILMIFLAVSCQTSPKPTPTTVPTPTPGMQQVQPQPAQVETEKPEQTVEILEEEDVVPLIAQVTFNSDRVGTWSVGGGWSYLRFIKELKIDPYYALQEGEIQGFSMWVEAEAGTKEMTATLEDKLTIPFVLAEGDEKLGRWVSAWIVHDIDIFTKPKNFLPDSPHIDNYTVTFRVVDREGREFISPFPMYRITKEGVVIPRKES